MKNPRTMNVKRKKHNIYHHTLEISNSYLFISMENFI